MPRPSPAALELSERWNLVLPDVPRRGLAGEQLARGVGSSLDFQDRRAYAAGDDVRHVDWRAYARTGQLLVKLYRDEVLPRVDLLLDLSRSMGVGADKGQRALDLAALFALAARRAGDDVRLVALREPPEPLELERFVAEGSELEDVADLERVLAGADRLLRQGSHRVLVSDLFAPHRPEGLVRRIARGAAGVAVVQVLAARDLRPELGAALRLTDAETGERRDLLLDAPTVERYLARLRRLTDALEAECRRQGAVWARVDASEPLEVTCRDALAARGVLSPA